jgi:hypothetical protein
MAAAFLCEALVSLIRCRPIIMNHAPLSPKDRDWAINVAADYHKKRDRAMGLAVEYRTMVEREGVTARSREIASTIDDLVGHFIDGKLSLPDDIRTAMGRQ